MKKAPSVDNEQHLGSIKLDILPAEPLVSVIIGNYNYADYIGEAIESVLHQAYEHLEVVVCDDGSTDGSAGIIDSYTRRDPRVRLLRKENGGQASAWNAAYKNSHGDIIVLLDSDDYLAPDKVKHVVEYFREHSDVGFLLHALTLVDGSGNPIERIPTFSALEHGWIAERVVARGGRWRSLPTSGISFRRSLARYVFPIPEPEFRKNADSFVFTLAPLLTPIGGLDEPLAYYRVHSSNVWNSTVVDRQRAVNMIEGCRHAIRSANERLRCIGRDSAQIDEARHLAIREHEFVLNLYDRPHYWTLVGSYRAFVRRLLRDDLHDATHKAHLAGVYGVALLLPRGAITWWLTNTLGSGRLRLTVRAALWKLGLGKTAARYGAGRRRRTKLSG